MKKLNTKQFIERARSVHQDKYTYESTVYIKTRLKVKITCRIHGVFRLEPRKHLSGRGCQECGLNVMRNHLKSDKSEFIEKAKKKHGDTYDYSKVDYKGGGVKVTIVCKEHGKFYQTPNHHIRGRGCSKCGRGVTGDKLRLNTTTFKKLSEKIHGKKYDYSKSVYSGNKSKLKIICKIHGVFKQRPNSHMSGQGCFKCSNIDSTQEIELYNFINDKMTSVRGDRKLLKGKELDIYIPSKNIAIEYDGLYWHSDKFKEDDYHLNKTNQCKSIGVRLVHIFEDEWLSKKSIVKSRLLNILGKTKNRIYARRTKVKEVPTAEAMKFLDKNHIQGRLGGCTKLGLYIENELYSIMTFGNLRKNMGRDPEKGSYELLRFCNKLNTTVVGGASKLLKHFERNYNPKKIISYADKRWSEGNLYENLGFVQHKGSKPNYYYVKGLIREGRYKYAKHKLVESGFCEDKTERQIMKERGYRRIYDCGNLLWVKSLGEKIN